MTDVFPASIQSAGTVRVQLVLTLANPLVPTATEINAASSLNLSPYFKREDFQIGHDQEVVDDTRLSDIARRQALGVETFDVDMLRYIHNPQAAAAAAGNKAYDALTDGLNAYFVTRLGTKSLLASAAFATTQRVGVWGVQFGGQHQTGYAGGDGAVHLIEQKITITPVIKNFILAA